MSFDPNYRRRYAAKRGIPIPRVAAEKRRFGSGGPSHAWQQAEIEGRFRNEHGTSGNAKYVE
jgi:hypothetical protein